MSNPIKLSIKTEWFALCLLLISFVSAFYFYQNFPAQVPSHWNIRGEVDSFSGPFTAAFLVPLMMIGMYLMFIFLPYLDPKKDQYGEFAKVYHNFKDLILVFLFILYFLTGINGLGYTMNIGFLVPIMVGVLFMILGFLLQNIKMNWFLGIRTPWTMSSETVWKKTHQLSSPVLMVAGLLMAATAFVSEKAKIVLFIFSIAIIIFTLPIYSYVLYAREKKFKK